MNLQNDIEDFVSDNEKLIDKWGKLYYSILYRTIFQ